MDYVKKIALKCLIENHINDLPVNVFSIRSSGKTWEFFTYSESQELLEKHKLLALSKVKHAIAIKISETHYYIFYNDKLSYEDLENVIAHELGHIYMGHGAVGAVLGKSSDKETEDKQEAEANAFVRYLLAPACVLAKTNTTTAIKIHRVTTLSNPHTLDVVDEVAELRNYTPTPEEVELCKQFHGYISRQRKHGLRKKAINTAASVGVGLIIFMSGYMLSSLTTNNSFADNSLETSEPIHTQAVHTTGSAETETPLPIAPMVEVETEPATTESLVTSNETPLPTIAPTPVSTPIQAAGQTETPKPVNTTLKPTIIPAETPAPTVKPTTTPESTQEPTITPTETPTQAITKNNELSLVSITTPTGRNKQATVTVKGLPNTEYNIDVHYPSGISKAAGLGRKTSDSEGNVSWTWKIGGNTTKGTHYLTVSGGGGELRVEFEIK